MWQNPPEANRCADHWFAVLLSLIVLLAGCKGATEAQGPAPMADRTVFVGAGDIATCGREGDEATASILDTIPGNVFTAGDNVYENGTPDEFINCYGPTWGRHRSRTRPTPGEHEYGTPDAEGYFDYFGAAAGTEGEGWYSYDIEDWHIVSLNSVVGQFEGSPQIQWLNDDLVSSTATCTIAVWHNPRFSSSQSGSDPDQAPLWNAAYRHGVDVVINGHAHHYERFGPQDTLGNSDPTFGIRQFVVGTGGRSLTSFADTPAANSVVRDRSTFGVVKLALRDGSYAWEFIPVETGGFRDTGSANCHGAPP
jgi:hypothetical protein